MTSLGGALTQLTALGSMDKYLIGGYTPPKQASNKIPKNQYCHARYMECTKYNSVTHCNTLYKKCAKIKQ